MQDRFRIVFEHHGDHMPGLPIGISIVNSDGSGMRLLRQTGSTPAWSPDGTWISFDEVPKGYEPYATNIFVVSPDGSHLRQITSHKDAAATRARWFSDSKNLVYSLWADQVHRIFTVNIDSGRTQQITRDGSLAYPEWTPRGEIVALDDDSNPSNVLIMSRNGANRHVCDLFQAGDMEMAWAPDGMKVAFVRGDSLCVMNADSTGLQRLEHGGPENIAALSVAWSPDSTGVVFSARTKDGFGKEVFSLDLKSQEVQPIVRNPWKRIKTGDIKYSEIIDVSCSPLLKAPKGGGLLSRLFTRNSSEEVDSHVGL